MKYSSIHDTQCNIPAPRGASSCAFGMPDVFMAAVDKQCSCESGAQQRRRLNWHVTGRGVIFKKGVRVSLARPTPAVTAC